MGYTESEHRGQASPSCSGDSAGLSSKAFSSGILLVLLLLLPLTNSIAQRKSDIGLIGGASYYMGDVNPTRHFYAPSAAGGIIYRYNLNPRNSFRFSAMYTSLKGSDSDFTDAFQGSRGNSFRTSIIDLGITTEFNFMDYQPTKLRKNRYSPYVCGGIGYASVLSSTVESTSALVDPNTKAKSTATLLFGGGFKYNLARRWSIGGEWTFRKTLGDMLDGTENIGAEEGVFFHNNDWYSIIGIFITYKIFNWREDCPAYD
jgi:opacity protein-like surface antigen